MKHKKIEIPKTTNLPKILYIHPGPVRPAHIREHNQFFCLSHKFSGAIISTTWGNKTKEEVTHYVHDTTRACGAFSYNATASSAYPGLIKFFWNFFYFLITGAKILFHSKDTKVIISYGIFSTGLAAVILKLVFRKKLIIEVPGVPSKAFKYEDKVDGLLRAKQALAEILTKFVLYFADGVKLLFPKQLGEIKLSKKTKVFVFHDFVPVTSLNRMYHTKSEPYLLFVGHPWYLKGVDLLIQSFVEISSKFPQYKLKILGYCPDMTFFKNLTEGNPQIEFLAAAPHEKVMELLSQATALILPSRTEAMGRVILEAMAMEKPIIASAVDGIPYYLEHNVTALLFESENKSALRDAIATLLENSTFQKTIAANGKFRVLEKYSEQRYLEHFSNMINDL